MQEASSAWHFTRRDRPLAKPRRASRNRSGADFRRSLRKVWPIRRLIVNKQNLVLFEAAFGTRKTVAVSAVTLVGDDQWLSIVPFLSEVAAGSETLLRCQFHEPGRYLFVALGPG